MMEINTTPLIDVLLVLIVMLIITIPIQLQGINFYGQNDDQKISPPEILKTINININENGEIFWDKVQVKDEKELEEKMFYQKSQEPVNINIEINPNAPYQKFITFISLAQKFELPNLGIVNE